MTYAVTGAAGQLGLLVARRLLDIVDPHDVVLLTRRPERLDDLAARGAEVRPIDFDDDTTLRPALRGVERLLLISTDRIADRLPGQVAAIQAAAEVGVQRVAYTSVPEPVGSNPAAAVPSHAGTENTLRESGMAWTFLRNNLYADMQVDTLRRAAADGRLVANSGDGAAAYVTRADCAAAAVAVLVGNGHDGQPYDVTGPQALTAADLAILAGEAAGRVVEPVLLDDDAYTAELAARGLPPAVVEVVVSFGASIRGGYLASVTSAVTDLSGREPTMLGTLLT